MLQTAPARMKTSLNSWEAFVVEYGFAIINQNGELHFDKKR
jgi:hypothetical protein